MNAEKRSVVILKSKKTELLLAFHLNMYGPRLVFFQHRDIEVSNVGGYFFGRGYKKATFCHSWREESVPYKSVTINTLKM